MKEELIHIYSDFSYINDEIRVRQNNSELKKDITKFWGANRPTFLPDAICGFLSRTIITPNLELQYYFDLMNTFNLAPLMLEFDGQFVAKNIEKYSLCKPIFYASAENLSRNIFERKTIVDFNEYEGELMSKVNTIWGEPLKDFHRKLLKQQFPNAENDIIDITKWFKETRGTDDMYYSMYLSLCIQNGVLFENFLFEDKDEEIFFHKKVLPSFTFLEKTFGLKPLIFPLLPMENEKKESWLGYPSELMSHIQKNIHHENKIQ